jgi:hypothetical protein
VRFSLSRFADSILASMRKEVSCSVRIVAGSFLPLL